MQQKYLDLLKIVFILAAFIWFLVDIIKSGISNIRIYQVILFISCILMLYEKIKAYRNGD